MIIRILVAPLLLLLSFSLGFAAEDDVVISAHAISTEFTKQEKVWLKAHPIIRMGYDPEFHPLEFLDESGSYVGMAADYIKLLNERFGLNIVPAPKIKSWTVANEKGKTKELDLFPVITPSPERKEYWGFTDTYLEYSNVIFTRDDYPQVAGLDSFIGKKLSAPIGYVSYELIKNNYPMITLVGSDSILEGLKKVSSGQVDAFVGDIPTTVYYMRKNNMTNIKVSAPTALKVKGFSMAVREDWPELVSILNKGLASITEEERQKISAKWIKLEYDPVADYSHFGKLLVTFSIILVMVFAWIRFLQKQRRTIASAKEEACAARDELEIRVIERTAELVESNKKLTAEIEERKQAEAGLLEKTNLLRAVHEANRDLQFILDGDGVITDFYAPDEGDLYVPAENFTGKRMQDVVPPNVGEQFQKAFEEASSTRALVTIEYMLPMPTGNRIFEGLIVSLPHKGLVVTARDITERIKAVDDLRESKENLSTTLNSIGDAVVAVDLDGKVVRMNPVAEKLTGWAFEEALGKPLDGIFNIINRQTREKIGIQVDKVRTSGVVIGNVNNTVLIAKDGLEYQITHSAAPIRDADGSSRGAVLVFRDVTEQKRMEEKIFKAKKLESVGILAGGIAHDFNNILTGLFGNIELVKTKLPQEHAAYANIKTAHQALESAKSLTQQLLTFAKGGDPLLEAVDLKQVIRDSIAFNLSGSNIKTVLNLPANLWRANADKGQVSQVVSNLTINARQAMPNGGTLTINAENIEDIKDSAADHLSGNYVKICIQDEGGGISPEHLEKVFDPYFTTKQAGSGLGLATVHSIVAKHNGHINIVTELGVGTTFIIYFPMDSSAQEAAHAIPLYKTEEINSVLGHVLIMDDDEMIRDLLLGMLKFCGYTADVAADGKEALGKYISAIKSDNLFDIVIMDLTIPGGMGGKEAVVEFLAIDPNVKVIVSSGYATDRIMANYRDYGFSGRLAKPFVMANLIKELSRIMALSRSVACDK